MIRTILFLSMTLFLFASCECSYQYNVYVKNDTKQDLTIIYKAKDAESEKTLELKPGGYEMIISSPDIKIEREVTKVEEAQGVAPSEGREAEEALRAASVVAPA